MMTDFLYFRIWALTEKLTCTCDCVNHHFLEFVAPTELVSDQRGRAFNLAKEQLRLAGFIQLPAGFPFLHQSNLTLIQFAVPGRLNK